MLSGLGVRWNGGGLGQSNKKEWRQKEEGTWRNSSHPERSNSIAASRSGAITRRHRRLGPTASWPGELVLRFSNGVGDWWCVGLVVLHCHIVLNWRLAVPCPLASFRGPASSFVLRRSSWMPGLSSSVPGLSLGFDVRRQPLFYVVRQPFSWWWPCRSGARWQELRRRKRCVPTDARGQNKRLFSPVDVREVSPLKISVYSIANKYVNKYTAVTSFSRHDYYRPKWED